MDLRREFVSLALQEGSNISQLCRRFKISRKTAYKWLGRSRVEGERFQDRSRRPLESPTRTAARWKPRSFRFAASIRPGVDASCAAG